MICTAEQIVFEFSSQEVYGGQGMQHVSRIKELHREFWCRNLNVQGNCACMGYNNNNNNLKQR